MNSLTHIAALICMISETTFGSAMTALSSSTSSSRATTSTTEPHGRGGIVQVRKPLEIRCLAPKEATNKLSTIPEEKDPVSTRRLFFSGSCDYSEANKENVRSPY